MFGLIFDIKPHERKIFELIRQTGVELGMPVYVVGGYVRDRLLGINSSDMDIVCVGSGIRFAETMAYKLRPIPTLAVYSRFGTAMLRHNDLEIEFVGARKESYRDDSRKPQVEDGTLEDDQNRRDFTINALAVSLNNQNFGEIIDPFNGIIDLEEKIIRTPLEPGKTFSDDPLRIMRAIRFAAQLGFNIEKSTYNALGKYRNRLHIVSQERITVELTKILATPKPSVGFDLLYRCGILESVFPELYRLAGVDMRDGKAHKDNFYHTLQVVDNLAEKSNNIWLRWATLLHDIGKPVTKRFDKGNGWTFHGHEAVGAAMVPRIFRKLRLPLNERMKYVRKMVRLHMRPVSLTQEDITDSAVRRLVFEAGDNLEDLMLLCEADITSKNPKKVARYLTNYERLREKIREVEERDHLRNWQPPVDGQLIMDTFGLRPSKEVGIIKVAIREAILEGHISNTYEDAYDFMLKKGKEIGLEPTA